MPFLVLLLTRHYMITGIISTLVNAAGKAGYSGDGNPAADAQIAGPSCLAYDTSGNLFLADIAYPTIRKVAPDGIITTVAGTGELGFSGDGFAPSARLGSVRGCAVDSEGTIYLAQPSDDRAPQSYIRKLAWTHFSGCQ